MVVNVPQKLESPVAFVPADDNFLKDKTGFPFEDEEVDFDDPESNFYRNSSGRGSSRLNKHLENLAARHPHLAQHFRPFGDNFPFGNRPQFDSSYNRQSSQDSNKSSASKDSSQSGCQNQKTDGLPNYGLRNTTDLSQKTEHEDDLKREQRSMSAPPDNRASPQPQRFVSRVNIDPKPEQQEMGQKQSNVRHIPIFVEGRDEPVISKDNDQTDGPKTEFVHNENFSMPKNENFTMPKNENFGMPENENFGMHNFPHSRFQRGSSPFAQDPFQGASFQPNNYPQGLNRPSAFYNKFGPHPQASPANVHTNYQQPRAGSHERTIPVQHENITTRGSPHVQRKFANQQQQQKVPTQNYNQNVPHGHGQNVPHYGQNVPQHGTQQQNQQVPKHAENMQQNAPNQNPSSQQQPKPKEPQDPLEKIKFIQDEVADLMKKVNDFNGTSKDKNYLYLDEMLTRNLIKLDLIETEGKDSIRQARKETIKCINQCISILEEKTKGSTEESKNENTNIDEDANMDENSKMEEDIKLENENKMEADTTNNVQENKKKNEPNKMEAEVNKMEADSSTNMEVESANDQKTEADNSVVQAPAESSTNEMEVENATTDQGIQNEENKSENMNALEISGIQRSGTLKKVSDAENGENSNETQNVPDNSDNNSSNLNKSPKKKVKKIFGKKKSDTNPESSTDQTSQKKESQQHST